jgi:endo-1,4-beta-xylanase
MHNKKNIFTRRRIISLGLLGLIGLSASAIAKVLDRNDKQWQKYRYRKFSVSRNVTLGKRAINRGLIYGAAVRQSVLSSDRNLAKTIANECNVIVPEWELEWNILRPTPTTFDFAPADWLANFAQTNRLLLRGHSLVWHEAVPEWFDRYINSQNARSIFLEHIQTVASRYTGKIHSWDVVNEAINISDGNPDGLRSTPWLKFLGSDYIDLAFRTAATADPRALLFYNDYELDYDTREADAKRDAVLRLLTHLKSKGTPIHGLGIQAHLSGDEVRFDPKKFKDFLNKVANLGLKILITEMDVVDKDLQPDLNFRDRIVAGVYEDYLSVALSQRAVVGILNWGISDRYTWLSEFKPRKDRAAVRPLPFDRNFNRKLAWNAIARAFDRAPKR